MSTVDPRVYDVVRAMAYADVERAVGIADDLADAGCHGAELVIGVAFVHAVHAHFGDGRDAGEINRLAADAVRGVPDGPSPKEVQLRIRTALAESDLTGADPAKDMLVQVLVLGALLPRIRCGEAVEEFVGEVMLDVVRLLTPPVGVGLPAWRSG